MQGQPTEYSASKSAISMPGPGILFITYITSAVSCSYSSVEAVASMLTAIVCQRKSPKKSQKLFGTKAAQGKEKKKLLYE